MEENGLPGYQRLIGANALDVVEIHPDDRVALVGAFVPFIKKLKQTVKQLRVVEKNPKALKGDEMQFYRPAEQAEAVLDQADVVVVSGSAIVHHSLDQLLGFCRAAREIIVAGPTASMYPFSNLSLICLYHPTTRNHWETGVTAFDQRPN